MLSVCFFGLCIYSINILIVGGEKSCTEETPNAVPGSYKLKTTSCNPEVNDACNNCFEGSKPKTSGVTGNYSIIMTYGIIIFTIIFRI